MRRIKRVAGLRKIWRVIAIFILLFSLARSYAKADENSVAGRKILEQYQNGVVSLKTVAKVRMTAGGKEQYNKEIEAVSTATVINPSGLAVTSAAMVNPGEVLEKIMKNFLAKSGGENVDITFNVELLNASVIMPDGKEVPVKVVLRDKDLDLAFLRPTKKLGASVFALDLSQSGSVNTLDPVVIINLLPKEYYGRKPTAILDRVKSVVEKPRKFYLPGNQRDNPVGTPVFNLDGKILGITVVQIPNTSPVMSAPDMISGSLDTPEGAGLTVIIPAADILELTKQIPDAEAK
ncbi:MAG: serine protease [Candidatus Omnitrophota bacterium]